MAALAFFSFSSCFRGMALYRAFYEGNIRMKLYMAVLTVISALGMVAASFCEALAGKRYSGQPGPVPRLKARDGETPSFLFICLVKKKTLRFSQGLSVLLGRDDWIIS
jgi:hypothetical protein